MFLNKTLAKEDISRKNFKYLELKENENTTYQHSWDAAKAVF